MAKRMRVSMGILCIVLTLLCLDGCDRDPEETEEVKEYYVFDPAVTWELRPLVTGDGVPLWYVANDMEHKPVDYAVTEEGVTWLYEKFLYDETGAVTGFVTYTETFGWDGVGHGRQAHPWKGTDTMPTGFTAWESCGDGTWLITEFAGTWHEVEYNLLAYNENGDILYRYSLPDDAVLESQGRCPPALAVSDSGVAISIGSWIGILDKTLQPITEQNMDREVTKLFFAQDGTLYGQDWNHMVVRFTADGRPEEIKPDDRMVAFRQVYIEGGACLCSVEEEGIFRFSDGNSEGTLDLDWTSSGILWQNTEILQAMGKDRFLLLSKDNMERKQQYAMLVRCKENGKNERKHISVVTQWMGTRINAAELAAVQFNQINEQYYVTVEAIETKDRNEYEKILFERMEAGNSPDIVLFENHLEDAYLNLEWQGYLCDLTEYGLGKDLTGSAWNAAARGEKLYRVPYTIQYDTLIRADGKDSVTMEELIRRAETGETLFGDPFVQYNLRSCVQSLFTDPVGGTCTLDSPEFLQFLGFYGTIRNAIDNSLGYLGTNNYDGQQVWYMLSDAEVPEKLRTGELPFLRMTISSMDAFAYLDLLYGETEYAICGFPGLTMLVSGMQSAAILNTGKNPDGAAEFLQFLLSDTVQASSMVTDGYVPVTWGGVEKELSYKWRYCQFLDALHLLNTRYKSMEPLTLNEIDASLLQAIPVTEEDRNRIRSLLDAPDSARFGDLTLEIMIREELEPYLAGDRTAEDTGKILQSRVGTYLAENRD